MHVFGFYTFYMSGGDTVQLPSGYVLNGNQTHLSTSQSNGGAYGNDGSNAISLLGYSSYGPGSVTVNTNINVRKTN